MSNFIDEDIEISSDESDEKVSDKEFLMKKFFMKNKLILIRF